MAAVYATDLYHYQRDGQPNANLSCDISSKNLHRVDNMKPDIASPLSIDGHSKTLTHTAGSIETILSRYEGIDKDKELDAKTLIEENQRLRDMTLCKICMDKSSCIVLLPCGYMVCCANCSLAMRKCPICRVLVRATVKAFTA
ncbi:hypothetical protein CHS0354_018899 [Potamilus streckersoni]|uniref:RING-type domain-containing protein n=1 Tax=Potamilus streckersoni TaxID=2493646 RepID=A0AAE0SCK4_9BIVA|nr:hypothetical protein CHS0354_018899 [Potamilus streckersoni]